MLYSKKGVIMTKFRAKADSVLISGVHASFWAAYTVQTTFLITYLALNGYSPSEIGLLTTIQSLFNLVAQPVWGYLSDSKFKLKTVMLICMVFSIPVTIMFPRVVHSYLLLVGANCLFAVFELPIMGLLDSITNMAAGKNKYVIYGVSRGCGSFFSAVACLFAGGLLDRLGIEYMFVLHAVLMLAAIALLCGFRGTSYSEGSEVSEHEKKKEERVTLGVAAKALLVNPKYMALLFSTILLNIGLRAGLIYTPIMIVDFGGTSVHNGYAMAVNTIGMAPCMLVYSYLIAKKIPNHKLYMAGCIFTIIRIFSLTWVSSLGGLIGVQIINSLSYGFLQPAMIASICAVVTKKLHTTAITFTTAVFSAASSLLGGYIAGFMVESWGMQTMFFAAALFAVAGTILYLPVCRE